MVPLTPCMWDPVPLKSQGREKSIGYVATPFILEPSIRLASCDWSPPALTSPQEPLGSGLSGPYRTPASKAVLGPHGGGQSGLIPKSAEPEAKY